MDDKTFNELLNSTKEAKQILSKKVVPSRTFYIDELGVKQQCRYEKSFVLYKKCII